MPQLRTSTEQLAEKMENEVHGTWAISDAVKEMNSATQF